MTNNQIVLKTIDYRPCYVNGKKDLFHRWVDIENSVVKETYAIVEYENGTVEQIVPNIIVFADRLLNQYSFIEGIKK